MCLLYDALMFCLRASLISDVASPGMRFSRFGLFSFPVESVLVFNLLPKFSAQPREILSCTDNLDWNQLLDNFGEAVREVVPVAVYIPFGGSRQRVVS